MGAGCMKFERGTVLDYEVLPELPTMEVLAHLRGRIRPKMRKIYGSILLRGIFGELFGHFRQSVAEGVND
jgi:hypothetical protein